MNTLPATRLARRQARRGRWSLAIAIALAVNALLIGVLARSAPAIDASPLPPGRPLLAGTAPPPPPAAPSVAQTAVADHAEAATAPRLPALPAPAIPAAALAPPSVDGWLTGLGGGTATGATAATPATGTSGALAWDHPPRPEGAFDLERFYPLRQRRRGEGATVVVAVAVAADGTLSEARVVENDGPPAFAEASLRAVRALRWIPAELAGRPVAGEIRQSIVWRVP